MACSRSHRGIVAFIVGTWSASDALAEERMLRSPHMGESHVILGAKSVALVEREPEGSRGAAGGGAFLETTLVEDLLELELGFVMTTPGEIWTLAAEPLVKVPLHLGRACDGYVGAGPVLTHTPAEHRARAGAQWVTGAYVWWGASAGVDLDFSMAVLGRTPSVFELSVGVGPVVRF